MRGLLGDLSRDITDFSLCIIHEAIINSRENKMLYNYNHGALHNSNINI